jgi:Uma2 family endonuclease
MGPPDLAIEVLSPDDRAADIRVKVNDYLTHGVQLVWVVNPDEKTVTSYRRSEGPVTVGIEGRLNGGPVLPGFEVELRPLFS